MRIHWNSTLAILGVACIGCGTPDVAPPEVQPVGAGMPMLERRPFQVAESDLPEGRFMSFDVATGGRVVYAASNDDSPKFRVLDSTGMRLAEGRAFTAADRTGPAVVILNEALARRVWGERSPVGECVHTSSQPDVCAEASQAARALDQLRPEQRQVLVATCHGLSHGEIAAQTGMPLGTVKAHARRGLLSIRAALLGVQQEDTP